MLQGIFKLFTSATTAADKFSANKNEEVQNFTNSETSFNNISNSEMSIFSSEASPEDSFSLYNFSSGNFLESAVNPELEALYKTAEDSNGLITVEKLGQGYIKVLTKSSEGYDISELYYDSNDLKNPIGGYEQEYNDEGKMLSFLSYGKGGEIGTKVDCTYNSDGKIETELVSSYEDGELKTETKTDFTYHANGKAKAKSTSVRENGEIVKNIDRTFDTDGKLGSCLVYENGEIKMKMERSYSPDGNTETGTTLIYENGEIIKKIETKTGRTYYPDGKTKAETTSTYANDELTAKSEYTYNVDGSIDSLSAYNNKGDLLKKEEYKYDSAGELIEFTTTGASNSAEYKTKYDDSIITVENKAGEILANIDTNELLKEFKEEDRARMAAEIRKMHPEALIDLYKENIPIGVYETHECPHGPEKEAKGEYHDFEDKIYMKESDFTRDKLTHEVGHAIDFIYQPDQFGQSQELVNNARTNAFDSLFLETFNEEQEAFMKETGLDKGSLWEICYGAKNPLEGFAESYTITMFPEYTAASPEFGRELFQQYFPRTIAESAKLLEATRMMPQEVRSGTMEN